MCESTVLVTHIVTIESVPLLLVDVETEQGVTGRTYLFGYTVPFNRHLAAVLGQIDDMTRGESLVPVDLFARLRKGLTLIGSKSGHWISA